MWLVQSDAQMEVEQICISRKDYWFVTIVYLCGPFLGPGTCLPGLEHHRTKTGSSDCTVQEGQEALSGQLQVCTDWLRAYFREPQVAEKLPMPCFHHPVFQEESFTSRVLRVLQRDVRLGATVSYKRLAEMSGNINAVRAVGGAMRRNPVPLLIPCHRVIASNGQIGNYMGGQGNHLKQWLLAHEKANM
ncbi:methylated-DNA--protein-cysteine methyltransferase-like [Scleropages formosus]|uniref:Methylated-DNA--protein-cysteine methyltransferase n=1 Tax=Scleropages formosus TaxID=113540 RepID=A0A0P7VZP5_SCLFO|nr:methylated-DNA--protein-cysteine methyltransferase-like [Scleropages formosus]